ncbi:uncharacterized protein LOC119672335 isoform X1 [Teleopsis dalmanni]|uniref:uncharacterized protein LOC119672335 isoform X1 n=1 Tax=Teleopsis dalmanni TaxID=139649 RepID=UPI0018CEFD56|nr:uncharacterized protein LOC119672335 isoform X1 [Teleopsis dalmanni]
MQKNSDNKIPVMSAITTADTSSPTTDRIEWSRTTILNFIEDYRQKRVLWDPNTKGYHIKQTKYEALKTLGQKYGTEIRSIRSKIKSLRSSFHREHGKVLSGRRKGVHYQPMWFAYEAIRFILDGEPVRVGDEEIDEKFVKSTGKIVRVDEQQASGVDSEEGAIIENASKKNEAESCQKQKMTNSKITYTARAAVIPALTHELDCVKTTTTTTTAAPSTATTFIPMTTIPAIAATATTTTGTYSYADDNNFVARVAGVGVGVGEIVGRNNLTAVTTTMTANEEFAAVSVTRSYNENDVQSYCNIRAEDVKTEIIEGDITDLSICERQRAITPSSYNFYQQKDSAALNKKRKAHLHLDPYNEEDGPSTSKQTKSNEHSIVEVNQCDSHRATTPTDEYGVFGEYVAITIRKLKSSKSKIVVKHLINNLLYEAEMGKYDQGIPSTREPPQLYKM